MAPPPLEELIIIEREPPLKVREELKRIEEDEERKRVRPKIRFVCPPPQCVIPCECFKIVVRYEDGPGGPGLDLDSLEIKPAQPLGGGSARGGVDEWTNIVGFFQVFEDHAVLCVPHRLWFSCGGNGLTATISNLDGEEAEAEHIFCVRPRRVPVFFG